MIISKMTYRVSDSRYSTHEKALAAVNELQGLSKYPISVTIFHECLRLHDEQDKEIHKQDSLEYYVAEVEIIPPSQSLGFLAPAPTKGRSG